MAPISRISGCTLGVGGVCLEVQFRTMRYQLSGGGGGRPI